jgi:uncharacterized protein
MRAHLLTALICLVALSTASAASPPTEAALDAAVAAYEQGRFKTARAAFERLAKQDVPAANYNLAVMHLRGEVPRASATQALALMTRAAEAGFVTAMAGLGELYERGAPGLAANTARATQWTEKAAEAGSVEAQLAIGTAHYLGRGAALDKVRAARWFVRAAQAGDVGAQYLYAAMLETGDGVPQDLQEARYWYAAAARSGDDAAPFKVKELDAKLGAQPRV